MSSDSLLWLQRRNTAALFYIFSPLILIWIPFLFRPTNCSALSLIAFSNSSLHSYFMFMPEFLLLPNAHHYGQINVVFMRTANMRSLGFRILTGARLKLSSSPLLTYAVNFNFPTGRCQEYDTFFSYNCQLRILDDTIYNLAFVYTRSRHHNSGCTRTF